MLLERVLQSALVMSRALSALRMSSLRHSSHVQQVKVDVTSTLMSYNADISLTFGTGPKEVDGKSFPGVGYYETIA